MKIVVDSNIIFSTILNTESKIGQLVVNGSKFSVANLVGGTIVIPHTGRALEYWEALHGGM